jgi:hypothetical protein
LENQTSTAGASFSTEGAKVVGVKNGTETDANFHENNWNEEADGELVAPVVIVKLPRKDSVEHGDT